MRIVPEMGTYLPKKSTATSFFVPAGTLIAVKLLSTFTYLPLARVSRLFYLIRYIRFIRSFTADSELWTAEAFQISVLVCLS